MRKYVSFYNLSNAGAPNCWKCQSSAQPNKHPYVNADHAIFLFIVVNYTFTQFWLCGKCSFSQISCCHINTSSRSLHLRSIYRYQKQISKIVKSIDRTNVDQSFVKAVKIKRNFRRNQYAIKFAVRSALRRCMGKQNELLRIEKTPYMCMVQPCR
jgi:hypothetical protein